MPGFKWHRRSIVSNEVLCGTEARMCEQFDPSLYITWNAFHSLSGHPFVVPVRNYPCRSDKQHANTGLSDRDERHMQTVRNERFIVSLLSTT